MEHKSRQNKKGNYNPIVDVFSKLSIELHLIIIIIFVTCCLNTFNIYRWHFGNINYAIERDLVNRDSAETIAKRDVYEEEIADLEETLEETFIATIPFFGMKVYVTDYTLFLIIMSFLLVFWLYKRLILLKNLLANYLNYFDTDEVADKTIYSLFFIIFPSFKRPHVYIERVMYVFLAVLYLLLLSNLSEIFFSHRDGDPLIKQAGFFKFLPHLITSNVILLFIIFQTHKIISIQKKELIHIRNILLLIRWNDYSFFPGLYEAFENTKPLSIKKNYIEYRNYGDSDEMNLVITVQREDTAFKMAMNEEINLIERYISFVATYKSQYRERIEPCMNKYSGRELTAEEELMKNFFKDIITNDSKSNYKIAQDYKKVIGADSDIPLNIKNVKELIVKDKVTEALEMLLKIIPKNKQDEIVKLVREYNQIEKNYVSGLVSLNESRIMKNRLVDRILKLISDLK